MIRALGNGGQGERSSEQGERGSGTVLAVGLLAMIMVLFVVGATAGGYLVAGHHARAAADLAALAGAGSYSATADSAAACAAAVRSARSNGARLVHCDVVGDVTDFVVTVRTEVDVGRAFPGLPPAMPARALAGPVPAAR